MMERPGHCVFASVRYENLPKFSNFVELLVTCPLLARGAKNKTSNKFNPETGMGGEQEGATTTETRFGLDRSETRNNASPKKIIPKEVPTSNLFYAITVDLESQEDDTLVREHFVWIYSV